MYLTEKEILVRQKEQLFGIQKIVNNSDIDLDDIAELIPGLVHLNRLHTLELAYLDKRSRETLEVKKEEVLVNGMQVLKKFVKRESFLYAKKHFSKLKFDDPSQVVSHFQELKGFPDRKKYKWYYSVKKRFNDRLILTITNPVESLGPMQKQVEKILEENKYLRRNMHKLENLTRREKEIIKLISCGITSNQIAEQLFLSPHTVKTHRKNIWQKLGINSYAELLKFGEQFNLI